MGYDPGWEAHYLELKDEHEELVAFAGQQAAELTYVHRLLEALLTGEVPIGADLTTVQYAALGKKRIEAVLAQQSSI